HARVWAAENRPQRAHESRASLPPRGLCTCCARRDAVRRAEGMDATRMDATRMDATRMDATRMDATRMDATRRDTTRRDTTRVDTTRVDTTRVDTTRVDTTRRDTTRDGAGGDASCATPAQRGVLADACVERREDAAGGHNGRSAPDQDATGGNNAGA